MQMLDTYQDAQIGDGVTLKGGGPAMTITGFEAPAATPQPTGITNASLTDVQAEVRCAWFTEAGGFNSAVFPLAALNITKKVAADEAPPPAAPVV